ncbi:hypothetical protein T12_13286, partial [Trichinella patagoniensis]
LQVEAYRSKQEILDVCQGKRKWLAYYYRICIYHKSSEAEQMCRAAQKMNMFCSNYRRGINSNNCPWKIFQQIYNELASNASPKVETAGHFPVWHQF